MLRLLITLIIFGVSKSFATDSNKYQYHLDLINVMDDKVKVTLIPPLLTKSDQVFVMPMAIPGSYAKKDYGRFIHDFKVFDANDNEMNVVKRSENDFYISRANEVKKIQYWVEDTWDHQKRKNFVFQPGGTNIEAGKNYMINHHGFFGYFENHKNMPFELTVEKPDSMFATTYLKTVPIDDTTDLVYSKHYVELVDNPIMYCRPDTSSFMASETKIVVSVYNRSGTITAAEIAGYLKPLSHALEGFFGVLPVETYYFILYFTSPDDEVREGKKGLGGFGALEHSHCSVYFLPEYEYKPALKQSILDIGAHEFLHILTPLNLHSQFISDFNFRSPIMSKHLWLYEGVTEYFAWKVQAMDSLITPSQYRTEMTRKINESHTYPLFSFTEMSENVLKKKNQKRYLNVYSKGAILAMLLDIQLLDLSDGAYGLKDLMMELVDRYGPNKPFVDEALIPEIVQMTYPEIRAFFQAYVIEGNPIPYKSLLKPAGLKYFNVEYRPVYFFGNMGLVYSKEEDGFTFSSIDENILGIEEGDLWQAIDSIEVTDDNVSMLFDRYFRST